MTRISTPESRGKNPKQQRSEKTRQRILDGLREILIESGYGGLTMRTLADKCGISVGNLTYHFSNKEELVYAFFDDLLEKFKTTDDPFIAGSESTREGVMASVTRGIRHKLQPDDQHLKREIQAMACHDALIADALSKTRTATGELLADLLARVFPGAARHDLEKCVVMIGFFIEGAPILFGKAGQRQVCLEEILPLVEQSLDRLFEDLETTSMIPDNPRPDC